MGRNPGGKLVDATILYPKMDITMDEYRYHAGLDRPDPPPPSPPDNRSAVEKARHPDGRKESK